MSETKKTSTEPSSAVIATSPTSSSQPVSEEEEIVPVADVVVYFECSKRDSKKTNQ